MGGNIAHALWFEHSLAATENRFGGLPLQFCDLISLLIFGHNNLPPWRVIRTVASIRRRYHKCDAGTPKAVIRTGFASNTTSGTSEERSEWPDVVLEANPVLRQIPKLVHPPIYKKQK